MFKRSCLEQDLQDLSRNLSYQLTKGWLTLDNQEHLNSLGLKDTLKRLHYNKEAQVILRYLKETWFQCKYPLNNQVRSKEPR